MEPAGSCNPICQGSGVAAIADTDAVIMATKPEKPAIRPKGFNKLLYRMDIPPRFLHSETVISVTEHNGY